MIREQIVGYPTGLQLYIVHLPRVYPYLLVACRTTIEMKSMYGLAKIMTTALKRHVSKK